MNKGCLLVLTVVFLQACVSAPVRQDFISDIKDKVQIPDFIDVSYCTIYGGGKLPKTYRGVCSISDTSVVLHYSNNVENTGKARTSVIEHKNIIKVAHAKSMRNTQMQINGVLKLVVVTLTNKVGFIDGKKTEEWLSYFRQKNVVVTEAEDLIAEPTQGYYIRYSY